MSFLFSIAFVAAVVLLIAYGERLWPASTSQKGEWLNNATGLALVQLSQMFLVSLLAISVNRLVAASGGGFIDIRPLGLALSACIFVVAMDLGEYLFHRAQHAVPWLWAMHSLHHSDRAMNFSTTQRHFWLEPAIKSVSIWPAVAMVFKVDNAVLGVYFVVTAYNFLSHANIRLGFGRYSWLLNSPQYHRLHHSRQARHHNTNFAALLPIFDVLTGAYRRPESGEFPSTGLDDQVATPLTMIIWPLRSLFQARSGDEVSTIAKI